MNASYAECTARQRIERLFDAGSFHEWLPPRERLMSPHLAQLGVPCAFDDGVAIGCAALGGRSSTLRAMRASSRAVASARFTAPSWSVCCDGPSAIDPMRW